MRAYWLWAPLLLLGCGSSGATAELECETHDDALDKRWLIGDDVLSEEDDPLFELEVTITDADFGDGPNQPELADWSEVVRIELTEDYAVARKAADDTVLAAFPIVQHRLWACKGTLYDPPSDYAEELANTPQGSASEQNVANEPRYPLWFERPWARIDLTEQLNYDNGFIAATEAGYSDAVLFEQLTSDGGGIVRALDQGYLATEVPVGISWTTADDGTPGCAFDVPDFDPSAPCPNGELTVRYELRRLD